LAKGSKASLALAAGFQAVHGENAVPVASMSESRALEALGARGIVMSDAAVRALSHELGSFAEAKEKMRREIVRRYSWHELTETERANLERAQEAAKLMSDGLIDALAQLQAVDFSDENTVGLCRPATGEMFLARKRCGNYFDLVEDLIHEMAHAISQAPDASRSHTLTIELLWRRLYEHTLGAALSPAPVPAPRPAKTGDDEDMPF
jgi:hypothetical protein